MTRIIGEWRRWDRSDRLWALYFLALVALELASDPAGGAAKIAVGGFITWLVLRWINMRIKSTPEMSAEQHAAIRREIEERARRYGWK